MGSASDNTTEPMTSQEIRKCEEDAAKDLQMLKKQQEKSPQRPRSAKLKPPTTESPDAKSLDTISPDFLYLIPSNDTAKLAFSELLDRKKAEKLSPHHFQYMVDTGRGPLHKAINYHARSKSETPEVEDSEEPEPSDINLGFFKVSFDYENVTNSAKWVMGRGTAHKGDDENKRNVDILLAPPRSKFSKGLLAAHAYLIMHPESGLWMIHAAPDPSIQSEGSAHKVIAMLDEHEIFYNGFRCLDKPESRLLILGMEFRVQFALKTYEACVSYRDLRNQKLREHKSDVPDTDITGIPLRSDIRASDLAVFSLGLGSGSFGSVYQAFDPKSGDLRIVKVIELKDESAIKVLTAETDMVTRFPNTRGLVRQYGWCNSNGDPTLKTTKYPVSIYIIQRKGEVFNKHSWQSKDPGIKMEILKLCQDLLHGVNAIHRMGWMHRDITVTNMLYFKGNPAEAALCDFGKLYLDRTARSTRIAAWAYLPPEIVQGQLNNYNQSIDIWMLAYALVRSWYYRTLKDVSLHSNGQITRNGLRMLRSRLYMTRDHGLAKLLCAMLSEEPHLRPTAEKALEYPCFQLLKAHAPPEEEPSKGKRHHRDEDSIDIQAIKEQANRAE